MPAPRTSLFDLQINGFAGVDFQHPEITREQMQHAIGALRARETHRIFLTLISAEPDALCRQFERLERFRALDDEIAQTICGYHLEGPFLSPKDGFRGAHPAEVQRAPDLAVYARLQCAAGGHIRLLTLAPEWPGSAEFIAGVAQENVVVVSLGHTDASEAEIDAAIAAGATLCTHLGNGVPTLLPRHDNVVQRLARA